ncbi:aspartyl/glutamyl-tRNA(Asn/Gln) amidotransferase subunit C [Treponema pallidum subsp. pallidum str. Sea 81-4]|nr:aspartyl/glutamyl-tRNA(Asn/Gln) amidotransferase subunit C [Treponema pallidum subsp. pallidum str. Sea 81-4]
MHGRPCRFASAAVTLLPPYSSPAILVNKAHRDIMAQQRITSDIFAQLLTLSHLESSECAVGLATQIEDIIQYFSVVEQFDPGPRDDPDTDNAQGRCSQGNKIDVDCCPDWVRKDVALPGLSVHDLKRLSTEFADGYFRAPRALDGSA